MPMMPHISCPARCCSQPGLQGTLAALFSPKMQKDPHPTPPVPVPCPPCPGPPYLACRGCRRPPGLEDDQVRPSGGVWQLSPVAVQERVQDTRFIDSDQGGQVLGLVQLRGVGL